MTAGTTSVHDAALRIFLAMALVGVAPVAAASVATVVAP